MVDAASVAFYKAKPSNRGSLYDGCNYVVRSAQSNITFSSNQPEPNPFPIQENNKPRMFHVNKSY